MSTQLAWVPAFSGLDQYALEQVLDRLIKQANPLKVILFGSRARGQARPSSDVDLLVVLPNGAQVGVEWDAMLEAVQSFRPPVALVVTTAEELAWRSQVPFFVQHYAAHDGYLLYERP